jgi:hypothetical protein
MARVSFGEWLLLRAVVFRAEYRRLLPEGPLGEQRDDPNIALWRQGREFFGDERSDLEIARTDEDEVL